MTEINTKTCRSCEKEKLLCADNFSPLKAGGFHPTCKPCSALKAREYRKNNPEKVKETERNRKNKEERKWRSKQYYYEHQEKLKAKQLERNKIKGELKRLAHEKYYQEHKEEIEAERDRILKERKERQLFLGRKRYWAHREERNQRSREYYKKTRQKQIEDKRKWRSENPEESRKRAREYKKKHPEIAKKCVDNYRSTPHGKLSVRIGNGIRDSLKRGKNGQHWEELVGYTIEQLESHLKKTVPNGYVWQDFLDAALHIDHKTPIAVFNFEKPEDDDFKKCWSLDNLQLLPARINQIKGANIEKSFQPSLIFNSGV